ncbi:MAG: hypothetical protein ABIS43_23430 [Opitutus sp.]
MTRGWAIGTRGWRTAVAKDHAHLALSSGVSDDALQEIKAARWNEVLARELAAEDKNGDNVSKESKSCAWKIKVAHALRAEANAPYSWIAKSLNMGSPTSVRVYLSRRINI